MMKYEAYEKPEATVIELGDAILTDVGSASSNANADANAVTRDIDTFLGK